jgi:hypothetical protein
MLVGWGTLGAKGQLDGLLGYSTVQIDTELRSMAWSRGFGGTQVFLSLLASIVLHRDYLPTRTEMDTKKKKSMA